MASLCLSFRMRHTSPNCMKGVVRCAVFDGFPIMRSRQMQDSRRRLPSNRFPRPVIQLVGDVPEPDEWSRRPKGRVFGSMDMSWPEIDRSCRMLHWRGQKPLPFKSHPEADEACCHPSISHSSGVTENWREGAGGFGGNGRSQNPCLNFGRDQGPAGHIIEPA